jgi:hypothetical protein
VGERWREARRTVALLVYLGGSAALVAVLDAIDRLDRRRKR